MTTGTLSRELDEYLAAVRASLSDLPSGERDDLLADVETSLLDASAEGGSLTARLGPPDEFASELRTAAGLKAGAPAEESRSPLVEQLRRVGSHPAAARVRETAHELAPLWWAARGYLAVAAFAFATDAEWATALPPIPRFGTGVHGLAVVVVAVLASLAAGLALRRRGNPFPRLLAAVNVVLLLAAVPVAGEITDRSAHAALVAMAYAPPATLPAGLAYEGEPVANIYPFSRDGRLLHDVLLYDGTGRPLEIRGDRSTDPHRRFVTTNGNRPLLNVFPIRYYEPGTKRVARPNAAPYVEHPHVVTPALRP